MESIDASKLIRFVHEMGRVEQSFRHSIDPDNTKLVDPKLPHYLMRDMLLAIGLPLTLMAGDRLDLAIATNVDPDYNRRVLSAFEHFSATVSDELSVIQFLSLSSDHTRLYSNPFEGWDDVLKVWPDAVNDIESAGQCIALSLPTAAVFHLSRIAERGLRQACAKYIPATDLPQPPYQMMGKYLECIDNFAKIRPVPAGAIDLTEAASYFRPIKNVWRDNVSHAGIEYNEGQAKRCYIAIRDMLMACAKIL